MRQRGLGNPQARGGAARKDTVDAITKKFAHMQTTLNREGTMDALKIADSGARDNVQKLLGRKIKDLTDQLKKTSDTTEKENIKSQLTAWHHWKTQFEADALKTPNADATKDFFAWLLGKGKEEHHRNTPWYRDPQMLHLKDVQEWIDGFADIFAESKAELIKLAWKTPQNLDEAWLYFKFIVNSDWMKREDRFFWVDLVNLQEEKAKLGGGLLKSEIDENRPYVEVTNDDGEVGFVPMTQEDAFDPESGDILSMPQPTPKDTLLSSGKIATLATQLRQMANMHDPRERGRFKIQIASAKKEELADIAGAALVSEAQARESAERAAREAQELAKAAVPELESIWDKMKSFPYSLWQAFVLDKAPDVKDLPEKTTAEIADLNHRLQNLQTILGQLTGPLGGPAEVEAAPPVAETLAQVTAVRENLERVVDSQGLGDARQEFLRMRDQFVGLENALKLKDDALAAKLSGVAGAEIPGYLAINALLEAPKTKDIRDQVNTAVSRAVRNSPGLRGKTLDSQTLGKLEKTARVAKIMQEFSAARQFVMEEFRPKVGAEMDFLNETLQQRWKVWLDQAGIDGDLRVQFADMPRDPIRLRLYAEGLLGEVKGYSDLLWRYLTSTDGSSLRQIYANVIPEGQQAQLAQFKSKLDKFQIKLSAQAEEGLSDWDKIRIVSMRKAWKQIAERTGTERFVSTSIDYFNAVGRGLITASKSAAPGLVIRLLGNAAVKMAAPLTGGGAALGIGVGITVLANLLAGKIRGSSPSFTGLLQGALVQGMFGLTALNAEGRASPTLNFARFIKANLLAGEAQRHALETAADVDSWVKAFLPYTEFVGYALNFGIGMGMLSGGVPSGALGLAKFGALFGLKTVLFQTEWRGGGDLDFVGRAGVMLANFFRPGRAAAWSQSLNTLFANETPEGRQLMWDIATQGAVPQIGEVTEKRIVGYETKPHPHSEWLPGTTVPIYKEFTEPTFAPEAGNLNEIKYWDPASRAALAILSSDMLRAGGEYLTQAGVVGALGMGVTDLLRPDIPTSAKTAILGVELLRNSGAIVDELKRAKTQVIRNIDEMSKVDLNDVYFDHVQAVARWKANSKLQALNARRRLLPLRPKKKFLQSTESKFDKRTGEGLVKVVGGKRVQVQ